MARLSDEQTLYRKTRTRNGDQITQQHSCAEVIPDPANPLIEAFSAALFQLEYLINQGKDITIFMVNDNCELMINNQGQLLKEV